MIGFRCDYLEGCHPEILRVMTETNETQCNGYGADSFCESATEKIKKACAAPNHDVHFMVGGTPTNKTVLAWLLKPWQGVISASTGHVATHETGAIESTGHKVLAIPHDKGKITSEQISDFCRIYHAGTAKEHEVEPGGVYLSQPTEFGTLYSKKELEDIRKVCDEQDMFLFIDGARLGYALGSCDNDATLPDLARICHAFYIGGTKCGAICGEAVVVAPGMGKQYRNMMKQTVGILAKGRLLGIQFDTLFTEKNGTTLYEDICKGAVDHALTIAKTLKDAGFPIHMESSTNQQFAVLTTEQQAYFAQNYSLEQWEILDDTHVVARFCTSWATKAENVEKLCADIPKAPKA